MERGLELEKLSYDAVPVSEERREPLKASVAEKRTPSFRGV
jgi:hypothetical protein